MPTLAESKCEDISLGTVLLLSLHRNCSKLLPLVATTALLTNLLFIKIALSLKVRQTHVIQHFSVPQGDIQVNSRLFALWKLMTLYNFCLIVFHNVYVSQSGKTLVQCASLGHQGMRKDTSDGEGSPRSCCLDTTRTVQAYSAHSANIWEQWMNK